MPDEQELERVGNRESINRELLNMAVGELLIASRFNDLTI